MVTELELFQSTDTKIIVNGNKGRVKVKVKQSRYRPGVAQRVPGS